MLGSAPTRLPQIVRTKNTGLHSGLLPSQGDPTGRRHQELPCGRGEGGDRGRSRCEASRWWSSSPSQNNEGWHCYLLKSVLHCIVFQLSGDDIGAKQGKTSYSLLPILPPLTPAAFTFKQDTGKRKRKGLQLKHIFKFTQMTFRDSYQHGTAYLWLSFCLPGKHSLTIKNCRKCYFAISMM